MIELKSLEMTTLKVLPGCTGLFQYWLNKAYVQPNTTCSLRDSRISLKPTCQKKKVKKNKQRAGTALCSADASATFPVHLWRLQKTFLMNTCWTPPKMVSARSVDEISMQQGLGLRSLIWETCSSRLKLAQGLNKYSEQFKTIYKDFANFPYLSIFPSSPKQSQTMTVSMIRVLYSLVVSRPFSPQGWVNLKSHLLRCMSRTK